MQFWRKPACAVNALFPPSVTSFARHLDRSGDERLTFVIFLTTIRHWREKYRGEFSRRFSLGSGPHLDR